MLKGKVFINEQEESGNYQFAGDIKKVMTRGFQELFGCEANTIAFVANALILEKFPNNADYLQTFEYHIRDKIIKFWCINDDNEVITFLLPDEY